MKYGPQTQMTKMPSTHATCQAHLLALPPPYGSINLSAKPQKEYDE